MFIRKFKQLAAVSVFWKQIYCAELNVMGYLIRQWLGHVLIVEESIDFQHRHDFFFLTASRPALGSTQRFT